MKCVVAISQFIYTRALHKFVVLNARLQIHFGREFISRPGNTAIPRFKLLHIKFHRHYGSRWTNACGKWHSANAQGDDFIRHGVGYLSRGASCLTDHELSCGRARTANSLVAISGPWTNSFSYFAVGLTYLRRGPLEIRTVNWEAGKVRHNAWRACAPSIMRTHRLRAYINFSCARIVGDYSRILWHFFKLCGYNGLNPLLEGTIYMSERWTKILDIWNNVYAAL